MKARPKLLDLFCCAGGASQGYSDAGFEVHGVDRDYQKRYPFPFLQMDWLQYLETYGHLFDAFAASPPCQSYSVMKHMTTKEHEMLIVPVREALRATGKPYIIENVEGAKKHMEAPVMLCGSMFGLQTTCGAQLRRHRLFESNYLLMSPGPCQHGETTVGVVGHAFRDESIRMANRRTIGVTGPGNALSGGRTIMVVGGTPRDPAEEKRLSRKGRTVTITGSTPQQNTIHNLQRETFSVAEARIAMGIDWMVMSELSQAIPPAYTKYLGLQLIDML